MLNEVFNWSIESPEGGGTGAGTGATIGAGMEDTWDGSFTTGCIGGTGISGKSSFVVLMVTLMVGGGGLLTGGAGTGEGE